MIKGTIRTSDSERTVLFDATPFFAVCAEEDLVALSDADFIGPLATHVAEACTSGDKELEALFEYLSLAAHDNPALTCESTCSRADALSWLTKHRPQEADRLRRRPQVLSALERRLARLETPAPDRDDTL